MIGPLLGLAVSGTGGFRCKIVGQLSVRRLQFDRRNGTHLDETPSPEMSGLFSQSQGEYDIQSLETGQSVVIAGDLADMHARGTVNYSHARLKKIGWIGIGQISRRNAARGTGDVNTTSRVGCHSVSGCQARYDRTAEEARGSHHSNFGTAHHPTAISGASSCFIPTT